MQFGNLFHTYLNTRVSGQNQYIQQPSNSQLAAIDTYILMHFIHRHLSILYTQGNRARKVLEKSRVFINISVTLHFIILDLFCRFRGILKDQGTPDLHGALIINVSPVFNSKSRACFDLRYALWPNHAYAITAARHLKPVYIAICQRSVIFTAGFLQVL